MAGAGLLLGSFRRRAVPAVRQQEKGEIGPWENWTG